MAEEKIVEKIRKLLALSKSDNPHEAAIALQKATQLMEEYQIKNIDLIPEQDVTHSDLEQVTGQHFIWANTLALACANMFDCTTINYTQLKSFRFIGNDQNILCANQLFWHLFRAWKSMCNTDYIRDKPSDRKLYRKSHGLGFASMIYKRVQELTEKRHDNIVKSTGTDLVVVSDFKLDQYMEDNFQLRKSKSRTLTTSGSGYMQGVAAGNKVQLVAPIDTTNKKALS
jgi:hypothetical protein